MTDSRHPGPGDPDGTPGGIVSADPPPRVPGVPGLPDVTDTSGGLRIEVVARPAGVVVVSVQGELDMLTAPEMRQEVSERLRTASLVVLALDGVAFLGTSGLAALIELREQAHRDGVELRLACTERRVLRPLGIAGLHHLFDIHDDVEAALNS
ncbi:STAS domain-containing protein [Pseudonocardia nematodicida]|uniref:Anti-sigma factor antagonist n=1 Tax=Pseudonocardia nematodicida TaxID=1206997 RepID=A0ABV1KLC3_9PSEU